MPGNSTASPGDSRGEGCPDARHARVEAPPSPRESGSHGAAERRRTGCDTARHPRGQRIRRDQLPLRPGVPVRLHRPCRRRGRSFHGQSRTRARPDDLLRRPTLARCGHRRTAQFLEGLGFVEDNPPNAALLVESGGGETDIAVVELYNPSYDPETHNVTSDVTVLESWQDDLELGLKETPADLATHAPEFGTTHLYIDDCSDRVIDCCTNVRCGETACECGDQIGPVGYCWHAGDACCNPCTGDPASYAQQCNATFPACDGPCEALVGPGCW